MLMKELHDSEHHLDEKMNELGLSEDLALTYANAQLQVEANNHKELMDEESMNEEPMNEEPMNEEPMNEEPMNEEPIDEEPMYEDPMYEDPAHNVMDDELVEWEGPSAAEAFGEF
eukprot:gene7767-9275_t